MIFTLLAFPIYLAANDASEKVQQTACHFLQLESFTCG